MLPAMACVWCVWPACVCRPRADTIGTGALCALSLCAGKTWHTRGYAAEDLFATAMGSFSVTLNRRYMAFKRAVKAKPGVPFFVGPTGKPGFSSSVPTFLCNDDALEVFERESRRFLRIAESPYVPSWPWDECCVGCVLTPPWRWCGRRGCVRV